MMVLVILATPLTAGDGTMELNPDWEYVADRVMGGVSTGEVSRGTVSGREAARLTGEVSLDNNGGFIQMAFDLDGGAVMDASGWRGIEIDLRGNRASYEIRLRTDQLARPWQSFRAEFTTTGDWETVQLPWDVFEARKTDAVLDPARLRRIGVLAIGSEMQADIAVSGIRFYK
ncbi:Complex I intermediate-associated protein 30 [Sulfitobacter guttiformis KCTC 32187]|nr:Complex I intermediate-associated protein 30 [Sulfitobacter guttiformis KCTC 32187]